MSNAVQFNVRAPPTVIVAKLESIRFTAVTHILGRNTNGFPPEQTWRVRGIDIRANIAVADATGTLALRAYKNVSGPSDQILGASFNLSPTGWKSDRDFTTPFLVTPSDTVFCQIQQSGTGVTTDVSASLVIEPVVGVLDP